MIELIFVIVILGILAAVAVPKLADVQDDAQAANEQAGVGAIRVSLQSIHGKLILGSGTYAAPVVKADGTTMSPNVNLTSTNCVNNYPLGLSVTSASAVASAEVSQDADYTLALVLEPGSRNSWKTSARGATNSTYIAGPATINVPSSSSASLKNSGSWGYSPSTGTIVYKSTTAYNNAGF